jgi:hypothetical protein
LIGSVAFELIDEALKTADVGLVGCTRWRCGRLTVGDWWLERRVAVTARTPMVPRPKGSALAIVFGRCSTAFPSRSCSDSPSFRAGSVLPFSSGVAQQPPRGHVLVERASRRRLAAPPRDVDVAARHCRIAVSAAIGIGAGSWLRPHRFLAQGSPPAQCSRCVDTMLPEAFQVEGVYNRFLVAFASPSPQPFGALMLPIRGGAASRGERSAWRGRCDSAPGHASEQ